MRTVIAAFVMLAIWTGGVFTKHQVSETRAAWPPTEERVMVVPADSAPVVAFGYREAAADLLWIRALNYYATGLLEHGGFRYLRPIIDTIISLAPRFEPIYRWAGTTVMMQPGTITQQSIEISAHYLELGVKAFPDNYHLLFALGITYFADMEGTPAEVRDYQNRGAELISRAIHTEGAPPNLAMTAAAMQTRVGQAERAQRVLREAILTTDDENARQEMTAYFGRLADPERAEALNEAHEAFVDRWQAAMPHVTPTMFILLGEPPPKAIDFDHLATPHDIFGATSIDDSEDRLGLDDLVPVAPPPSQPSPSATPPKAAPPPSAASPKAAPSPPTPKPDSQP